MDRIGSSWAALILCCSCSSVTEQAAHRDPTAPAAEPSVTAALIGRVLIDEPRPRRQTWDLPEEMRPFQPTGPFVDESWLIDEEGGLANCVVTLELLGGEARVANPLEGALYEKVGPRYEPRVLVVTPGTEVTIRNRNSPCNGFMCRGRFNQFNFTMTAGNERKLVLAGRGPNPMQCDLRPYMQGVLFVSPSPFYALSGPDGRYSVEGLDPGRYSLRVWHERLGFVQAETREISVGGGSVVEFAHRVMARADRE